MYPNSPRSHGTLWLRRPHLEHLSKATFPSLLCQLASYRALGYVTDVVRARSAKWNVRWDQGGKAQTTKKSTSLSRLPNSQHASLPHRVHISCIVPSTA